MTDKPLTTFGPDRPFQGKPRDDEVWRSAAQTDSDRVLYSPEFRRLAGVTQVLSASREYVLHDRLTHSMKVAQTAERLAQHLTADYAGKIGRTAAELRTDPGWRLDPDVCHVAGLAHDLGHPPYGHAAEQEIQELLSSGLTVLGISGREILADGFEGNAQSLRIVARLSFRKDHLLPPEAGSAKDASARQLQQRQEEGLNLTWRTLAAIAKYPWLRGEHPKSNPKLSGKWSFYNTEKDYHDQLRKKGLIGSYSSPALQQSLEAQVMDWADDIAYAVHDLEDFFRSRRVPLDKLRLGVLLNVEDDPEWNAILDFAWSRIEGTIRDSWTGEVQTVERSELVNIAEELRSFMPSEPFSGSRSAHAAVQAFASQLIRNLQSACKLEKPAESEVPFLRVSTQGRLAAEFLKSLIHFYVINTPDVHMLQRGQRQVVRSLFVYLHSAAVEAFTGARHQGAATRRLPARLVEYIRRVLDSTETVDYRNDETRIARAVCDFVCSLTDAQAGTLHDRITSDSVANLPPYWLDV